jgi:hypothetical protein
MGQRNPNHQLMGGKHPIILFGFQPSKVVQDFFHPQYVDASFSSANDRRALLLYCAKRWSELPYGLGSRS